ncbi:glutaredoxin family protein [Glutamicibacter sp. X7]
MITVYSKPNCPQCTQTMRVLDRQGTEYRKVDITQDAEALAHVEALGYKAVPVVVAGEKHWYGFRPDLLAELIA